MERILITGGAGFIGSNACNILNKRGYEVISLDTLALGREQNLDAGLAFIKGDVGCKEDLERVGHVDYIIHLAGASSAPMFAENLQESMRNNILGYVTLLEFARTIGVKKVLFASTSSIYGNNPLPLTENQMVVPPNFYSVAKHCLEEISYVYHQVFGTEIIGFRFMSIYGPHEEHKGRFANLVSQFIWGVEQGKQPVIYGDGKQTRDFTNVRDVVSAFALAITSAKQFGFTIFNVGTASSISLQGLVAMISGVIGREIVPIYVPNPVSSGYVLMQQADLSRIEGELDYTPAITLVEGITEIISYRKAGPIDPPSLSF